MIDTSCMKNAFPIGGGRRGSSQNQIIAQIVAIRNCPFALCRSYERRAARRDKSTRLSGMVSNRFGYVAGLKSEGHEPVLIDLPGRIPGNFPGVIVWVGDITAKAAMLRRVGGA